MKAIVFLAFIVVTALLVQANPLVDIVESDHYKPAISKELIGVINAKETSWVAGVNDNFRGMTIADMKKMLSCRGKNKGEKVGNISHVVEGSGNVPTTFVSETNWPQCKTIGTIWNQAECGSCWAFGGVAAASDRFCISSKGAFNQGLSFGQVTECTSGGCEGGSASDTWSFIQSNGIVTNDCYPYYIPTCPPAQQPCLNFVNTPNCWTNRSCVNGATWTKYYVSQYYGLNSVGDAQSDMMTNGPFEACFDVYADFLNYKSGVYQHTSGGYLGGHCVKIQGWGVENGLPYWLVNNSWTTYWGNNGRFKILRGADECGIEDGMVAGTPTISSAK